MSSSSIWSRFAKGRWWFWQQHQHAKYEHPEAGSHRQLPRSNRDSNSNNERVGTIATRDAASGEDLLTQSHSMHDLFPWDQHNHNHSWREVMHSCASIVLHGAAMYIFWVYVKPRLVDYFSKKRLKDNNDNFPKWKRWKRRFGSLPLPLSFKRRRRCSSCHAKVDKKDNFCPQCGSPTCHLCVYCGAHIRSATDNFCQACGRPVTPVDKVITDEDEDDHDYEGGGEGGGRGAIGTDVSASALASSGNNNVYPVRNDNDGKSMRQRTPFHPPYEQHPDMLSSTTTETSETSERQALSLSTREGMTKPSTESAPVIPIVQADGIVPIVPAVFVEDSDDVEWDGVQQAHSQSLQLVSTDEELQNQQQEQDTHDDHVDRRHTHDQQETK